MSNIFDSIFNYGSGDVFGTIFEYTDVVGTPFTLRLNFADGSQESASCGAFLATHATSSAFAVTAASSSAFLVSLGPPQITTQPQDQTADDGTTATFTIVAIRVSTYQWQSSEDAITWEDLTGETTASYSLTATFDAPVYFRCVLVNDGGTTTSDSASLTVTGWNQAGELATEYFDAIVAQGGTISTPNRTRVSTLLTALAAANLFPQKILALYLYHGGVLNAARLNTIIPTTDLGSGIITWADTPVLITDGGFTPSASAYGETAVHPDGFGLSDVTGASIGFYAPTNSVTNEYTMGIDGGLYFAPNKDGVSYGIAGGTLLTGTAQNLSGFHAISREPYSTTVRMYRNSTNYNTSTGNAFTPPYNPIPTDRIRVGGLGPGSLFPSTCPIRLSFIAIGLSVSEMGALNTAVQAYFA